MYFHIRSSFSVLSRFCFRASVLRCDGDGGGDDGLLIDCGLPIELRDDNDVAGSCIVRFDVEESSCVVFLPTV
jgi:hypothetical protein